LRENRVWETREDKYAGKIEEQKKKGLDLKQGEYSPKFIPFKSQESFRTRETRRAKTFLE